MKDQIEVRFRRDRAVPEAGEIIIWPSNESWNDFGYKIRCEFSYRPMRKAESIHGKIFIGMLAPDILTANERLNFYEKRKSLVDYLSESQSNNIEASRDKINFFSMLPDLQSYRDLIFNLENSGAISFLETVNDVVIGAREDSKNHDQAIETEVFNKGFMRNSESYFAYHNASSILDGVEAESFSEISRSLNLKFKLEGFFNQHEINFKFTNDSLIPRRINILIGKNGLGKSQTLKYFCRAALRYDDPNVTLINTDNSFERPMINRLIAVATPGETSNTFPVERPKTQKLYYRRLNLTRGGRKKSSRSIGETLVSLSRSEEHIGTRRRWDIFIDSLMKSMPIDNLVIASSNGEVYLIRDLVKGGEEQRLERWASIDANSEPKLLLSGKPYPLSSGQLTFLKFSLLCSLYIENGSFVLIDEPETHLHPNLISDFVLLLDDILESTGSYAIIATHSAYFVREVPKDQVHVFLTREREIISIVNPRLNTFGAPVDSISKFVFEEDTEAGLTSKIIEKLKNKKFSDIEQEIEEEISLAALMDIRRRLQS